MADRHVPAADTGSTTSSANSPAFARHAVPISRVLAAGRHRRPASPKSSAARSFFPPEAVDDQSEVPYKAQEPIVTDNFPMRVLGLASAAALLAVLAFLAYRNRVSDTATMPDDRTISSPAPARAYSQAHAPRAQSTGALRQQSVDLFSEVTSLLPKSAAGDAQASYRIASAYEECWQFALNPAGFESDIKLRSSIRQDLAPKFQFAGASVARRCARFVDHDIGPAAMRAMLERAAKQGSAAARARLFAESAAMGQMSEKDLEANVDRVLASRDPEAFAALAPAMGRMSQGSQSAIAPYPAGNDLAEATWNVAACRLGRSCGASSPAVIGMCLNGGINCELRDMEAFYTQAVLPSAEAAKLGHLVNQLVQGTKP